MKKENCKGAKDAKIFLQKLCVFCAFAVFLPLLSPAQNREVDSLQNVLSKATHDTTRLGLMNEIGLAYYNTLPDSALEVWKRAVVLAEQRKRKYTGSTLNALLLSEGDALSNVGFIYGDRGMTAASLEYNFRSLRLRESVNDPHGIAQSLNNIAYLYMQLRDTARALDYYVKSEAGYAAIDDSGGVAFTRINRAKIQLARRQDSLALGNYTSAMNILALIPGQHRGYSSSLTGIGGVYLAGGRYTEAMRYFRAAQAIRAQHDDRPGLAAGYNMIGRLYLKQHRLDSAAWYAEKGFLLGKALPNVEATVGGAQLLSQIYREKNDYRRALEYYTISITARDSFTNEEIGRDLVREQLSYEYAKKSVADSVKNADAQRVKDAEIALRDSQLKAEEQQKYVLYGGLALVLVFLGIMVNRFRVTRRQKNVIERQKKIVDEKQKEVLDSIHYATRIQHALLAGDQLLKKHLPDYFVFYRPKDIVSGDFYWASYIGGTFWFCAADCTGHGVPGAFMSLLNSAFLNEAINEKLIKPPAEVFNHVRGRVTQSLAADGSVEGGRDGMDAVLCRFDFAKKQLEFSCAYNPLWIIRSENGTPALQQFSPDKMPVGKHERDAQPFTHHSVDLQTGDCIYLFTDGFIDQFGGPQSKKFTYRRLQEVLLSISALPMPQQEQKLRETFEAWKGNLDQIDDVLMVGIRIM